MVMPQSPWGPSDKRTGHGGCTQYLLWLSVHWEGVPTGLPGPWLKGRVWGSEAAYGEDHLEFCEQYQKWGKQGTQCHAARAGQAGEGFQLCS